MSIDTARPDLTAASTANQANSVPTKSEVHAALPPAVFEVDTARSLRYAALSVLLTLLPGVLAWNFLPLTWAWAPVWLLYVLVAGTCATGVWVIAHECGHGAFSKNKLVQDTVGFLFHSALLVPYFAWQRSHAVHHAKTNHLSQGETHVPKRADRESGQKALALRKQLGRRGYGVYNLGAHLLVGWPIYLISGATPSDGDGRTNHFWPWKPFTNKLFPARFTRRVLASTAGVLAMAALLVWWAVATSPMLVLALYVGPYLVNNAWLVTYTWLHHTDADTPHFEGDEWSYVRGAFCSIDRPYGRVLDSVHHHIGSTHAAHHLFSRIPHYHAVEATNAIKTAFPEMYQFDPTPIHTALWRLSTDCVVAAETETEGEWRYVARA
jgi:omega-6 fatty acid desaturase (delta-12 desaturase)